MKVVYLRPFAKQYKKLPVSVREKFDRQLRRLVKDPQHPSLRARKMVNREEVWEARIDIQYRFTFQFNGEDIVLRSIGTHEIYRQR
jgi:mRNA-degrading endonuclease RelE of RelBE toxin-antitoxin system